MIKRSLCGCWWLGDWLLWQVCRCEACGEKTCKCPPEKESDDGL